MEKRKYIQFISATKICHWHIKRFRPTATGVVNQDINFTQLTDGKVCQCREFLFGSNIAAAGKCLTTQLLNFIDAEQTAAATLPPAIDVKAIADCTVAGRMHK